ncbi:mercuric transport protein [Klebsiella pneumoniae]|nr:mercuric transport protein [Klebsiella pneumoniae]SWW33221.1 mercuric transport protein [Klebsiella pneumoniae]
MPAFEWVHVQLHQQKGMISLSPPTICNSAGIAVNAPDKLPPETRQPVSGYLWGALAVLTCPCHLPILAAVLAGTTAGAFLGEHWGVAALALTGLFVLAVTRLLRAFRGGS